MDEKILFLFSIFLIFKTSTSIENDFCNGYKLKFVFDATKFIPKCCKEGKFGIKLSLGTPGRSTVFNIDCFLSRSTEEFEPSESADACENEIIDSGIDALEFIASPEGFDSFDPWKKTYLIIHGFWSNGEEAWVKELTNAILKTVSTFLKYLLPKYAFLF